MHEKNTVVNAVFLSGLLMAISAYACSEYTVKSGDGIWHLNDAFCNRHGVPGAWNRNIFEDSQCSIAKTTIFLSVGEKLWFRDGCVVSGHEGDEYDNVFLSSTSADDIRKYAGYATDQGLAGIIFWALSDDLPFSHHDSILRTVNDDPGFNGKKIGLYWSNWSIYSSTRAISSPSRQLSYFSDTIEQLSRKHNVIMYYAFLETIPDRSLSDKPGTLYFTDPWSDLSPRNCSDDMLSDTYALKLKNKMEGNDKYKCENASKYNNIGTLTEWPSVKSILSIGGAGHDDAFEVLFNGKGGLNNYARNFLNSAKKIIKKYHVNGFDLDYENRHMNPDQEKSYLKLVRKLRKKLGPDAFITVTVLSNQNFLKNNFPRIAKLNRFIDGINLMTYDYHGFFDFLPGGTHLTGFNSNLYRGKYAAEYSVNASVQAALALGVRKPLLSFGAPLYVRSMANINKGSSWGLGQTLLQGKNMVIPAGDKDIRDCDRKHACTGMYTYRYYFSHLANSTSGETHAFIESVSTVTYINHLKKPQSLNYNPDGSN